MYRKSQWSVQDYIKENNIKWKPFLIEGKKLTPLSKIFKSKLKEQSILNNFIKKNKLKVSDETWSKNIRRDLVSDYLNINKRKVFLIDHHKAHSYFSYYASKFRRKKCFLSPLMGGEMTVMLQYQFFKKMENTNEFIKQ